MLDADYLFSVMLARIIQAQLYRCWRNALIACLTCPELLNPCCYVEGWIVLPRKEVIEIAEHGWISSDGRIVDPSLVLIEARTQPVEYFAGFTLTCQELPQRMTGHVLPLVCHSDYGSDGLLHPGYQAAQTQAWQYAHELARAMHLAESAIVVSGRAPTGATTLIVY